MEEDGNRQMAGGRRKAGMAGGRDGTATETAVVVRTKRPGSTTGTALAAGVGKRGGNGTSTEAAVAAGMSNRGGECPRKDGALAARVGKRGGFDSKAKGRRTAGARM